MKIIIWFVVIGLFMVMPTVAKAELDGNGLLQKCEPIEKLNSDPESMSSEEASGVVYCFGYIDSFLETFYFQVRAKIVPSLPYCLPADIQTRKEIVKKVVEYLKKQTDEMNFPAGYHLFKALREAYPCNVKNNDNKTTEN